MSTSAWLLTLTLLQVVHGPRAPSFPDWVQASATHRTRYEHLSNQFRAGAGGAAKALSLRTTLLVEIGGDALAAGIELADSRVYGENDNTPLDTTHVNALEIVQAYGRLRLDSFLPGEASGHLRAGRLTMDLGSRRLVARNRFRNTTNAFTGAEVLWRGSGGDLVRGFAVLPMQRRPSAGEDLRDNTAEMDRESTGLFFWGVFYRSRALPGAVRAEPYLFGLHEQSTEDRPTKARSLLTAGMRLLIPPKPGRLDLEIEAAVQAGSSRASAKPEDAKELDHIAYFTHASIAYTADLGLQPRLVLQHDFASGDKDPEDNDNGRFDTLFGARRFEYGPTGIYGAFARSNLMSPGVRLELHPLPSADAMIAYRPFWLAQARDAWTTAGVRDASGESGTFIGHQVEARIRWRFWRNHVWLETGVARLWLGEVATGEDPTYVYVQGGLR